MSPKSEAKGAVLLLAIGLFFTVYSFFIPLPAMKQDVITTPSFFPLAVGSIFSLLALCQLIVCLRSTEGSKSSAVQEPRTSRRLPMVLILLLLLGYILGMQLLGFLGSSTVMMAAALAISAAAMGRHRRPWTILLLAVVFAAGAFVLFDLLLDVPLPRGIFSLERLMGM